MAKLTQAVPDNARTLWILSPVYFDVESYLLLRDNLEREVATTPFAQTTTFVVVDDSGGTDPRIRELRQQSNTLVVEPPFSLGHQRALVFGLRTLAGRMRDSDVVVTMDADGEDQPTDLLRLIDPLIGDPDNLRKSALALRTRRQESPVFRVLYLIFKLFFRLTTGTLIRSGNYVAYRGWFARKLLFHPHFDLCYSSSVVSFQLPVERVPCERGRRYAGTSR
ncbi:MAG: glycosyltransferase, partial [Gemmatimonadota bacterium]|nr:glycosyltransferase [Gemmatimonadota bacterium]